MKKLSKQTVAGFKHSPMCGTIYDNGGFDYCLCPDSDNRDIREVSEGCIRKGLPLRGYIDPDGYIYHEDRKIVS